MQESILPLASSMASKSTFLIVDFNTEGLTFYVREEVLLLAV